MSFMKCRLLLSLALASAAVASFGQSATGHWIGHVDFSGFKAKDAQQQKMIAQMKPMLAKMHADLTLKANHTYSVVISGGPGNQKESHTGKWSQSGRTVTVTDEKGKPQKMTVSADGRRMELSSNDKGAPSGVKLIFAKG